ncbi:hypothetical protein C8Q70DRAFT_120742 [Cubamyces menziesii]|nr:hypothetical protein C8Q70DRAFT_120742 [Cubamyces menziesii]
MEWPSIHVCPRHQKLLVCLRRRIILGEMMPSWRRTIDLVRRRDYSPPFFVSASTARPVYIRSLIARYSEGRCATTPKAERPVLLAQCLCRQWRLRRMPENSVFLFSLRGYLRYIRASVGDRMPNLTSQTILSPSKHYHACR